MKSKCTQSSILRWVCLAGCVMGMGNSSAFSDEFEMIDSVKIGDVTSEKSHQLSSDHSQMIVGGLGETALKLLPLAAGDWQGGRVQFALKVDKVHPNYVTVRFFGSESSVSRLILFCEGKQIGYRHLGDIDMLECGNENEQLPYNGRFYYITLPLPMDMTKGKSEVNMEIRSTGRTWGYGSTFEQYQKPMDTPTRGIYRVYTHTGGCFTPPLDDKQGSAPGHDQVRNEPGEELLQNVKDRLNSLLKDLLNSKKPLNQMQLQLLARAYHVKWCIAYQNPKVVEQAVSGLDKLYADYVADPKIAQNGPATYNPEWFGLGPCGDVIRLLKNPIQISLDDPVSDGSKVTRRQAWSAMLVDSREWHRANRRLYTNQSMINDLYIFSANSGVEVIDPKNAAPRAAMLRYLYESIGLEPWLGSETPDGPSRSMGNNYMQLTARGLSKELGYVGYYGEVLDWVVQIYDVTRPSPDEPGDLRIKQQLEKIANARAVFRYPMLDKDGNRTMLIEAVVGWRDTHYPGDIVYGERFSWDGSALYSAAATLDDRSIGYSQQMLADNQFFGELRTHMADKGLRITAGLLGVPDQYETIKKQPKSSYQLPMTIGQPDFVFADEDDGVVAIKNGDEIVYASLYWRARNAVNFMAKVHYLTPQFDRVALVREQTLFDDSGMKFKRPDQINFGFGNGGPKYPVEIHSAHAGEELPIAKIPDGIKFRPGDESIYAGKGTFYVCQYGKYLIAMNCTDDRTFDLKPTPGFESAKDLTTGKMVALTSPVKVGPRSTMVLYVGK